MSLEEQWLLKKERLLGWLRLAFSLVAIIVIQINPERAARFPTLAQFSLYSFFFYSLIVLYLISRRTSISKKIGLVTTCLDLFWITVIVISTRGTRTPFFVYYLFPVITAGSRYGIRGSIPVALIGVALYGIIRFVPFFQRPIGTDLFIIRSAYLLVLAYIFGFLSEFERKQNKKLALLSEAAAKAAALDERRRIARVFHDHLLQVLAGLGLRLEICRRQLIEAPEKLTEELRSMEDTTRGSIEEIRGFLEGKALGKLAPGTLMEKLREELTFLRDGLGMRVILDCEPEDLSLAPAIEQELYYVLREGLTNIARHAQAPELELNLRQTENILQGFLKDRGLGFSLSEKSSGAGYGLTSMKDRIAKMGGHLKIHTAPGRGTEISFLIPLQNASQ